MNKSRKHQRGFTLIEIMVALTIIAIALGALIKASGNHSSSVAHIKLKTLGHYVGMNEIALLQAERQWPVLGTTHKSTEMAEHEWFWTLDVTKVIDPITQKPSTLTRKIDLSVYLDNDREQRVSRLSAYVANNKPKT